MPPTRRFRKLPARHAGIVMPLVLSVLMTFVISGTVTLKTLGPGPEFLDAWPAAWGLAWIIAFPTLLCVLPVVRRIVGVLVEPPGS